MNRTCTGARGAVLAVVVLLAAGCGSTVANQGLANESGGSPGLANSLNGGQGAPSAGPSAAGTNVNTPGGGSSAAGGQGGFAANAAVGGSGGTTGSLPNQPAPGANSTSSVRVAGPGITAKNIFVGIGYSSQAAAGDKAIGASGAAPSYDTRNVFDTIFSYANIHGGFAGRSMKAIYDDYNLTDATSTQDQTACAKYTQDNKVFVISATSDLIRTCSEHAKAVGFGSFGAAETTSTFKTYPHYINPANIRLDRLGTVTVNALFVQHYFTGKLGLITWEDPIYHAAMNDGYLATLSAHHITPATPPIYVAVPQTAGALSDTSAAMRSAVAKFVSLGIDHVIIVDGPAGVFSGDGLTVEFMNQAKSQQYYPRYGGNSQNGPGFVANPTDEENNALYVDQSDFDPIFDEGWHPNQARVLCFKIQTAAGFAPQNQNDEGIAALACDFTFALQRAINSVSVLSSDTVVHAMEQFGTSFNSAAVFGTRLAADRHDGGSLIRVETFQSSCSCLHYLSKPYDAG